MSNTNKAEKRSIVTDALETLGTIITDKPGCARDAIHIAVEPCVAISQLQPGERVRIDYDEGIMYAIPVKLTHKEAIGIVDPFLVRPVYEGEKFWLLVLPRKITSLRHVWEHPSFHPSDTTSEVAPPTQQFETLIETDANGIETRTSVGETHEDFMKREKAFSKQFLLDYALIIEISYEELLKAATEWIEDGEWLLDGGKFEGVNLPDSFWSHFHRVTGLHGNGNFFSCSC